MIWSTVLFVGSMASASTTGGIPRHPDMHGDTVVFTAGGDLWKASVDGGTAQRLTSHPGVEQFARISPDGESVAYTADYDGDSNAWVVGMDGGEPVRLTWHAWWWGDDTVWDWTPDGQSVLVASRFQSPGGRTAELFSVSRDGGMPVPLPISDVGPAKMGSDGVLIFNRHNRNFRTWKRYRGGSQQDLWRYDPATGDGERMTAFQGTDTHPMIADDGTIYFVSDRPADGGDQYATRNLFRYIAKGEAEQLTFHEDFDVDWPALDGDRIVYMHGGDLRVYTLGGADEAIDLHIPDEAHGARPLLRSLGSWVSEATPGPQAKRVAVVAHGDLFTVPAKDGTWRPVWGGSDGRVVDAAWSPDGDEIAAVADHSGEHEVWLVDQSGTEAAKQLTEGNGTWILGLGWSPDGKRIAYVDKRMRLYDVDAKSGTKVLVDRGEYGQLRSVSYSRDGSFLTYVKPDENGYGAVWLYDVRGRKAHRVTDDFNDDFSPAFDPKGRYLYFGSSRHFDLVGDAFDARFVRRNVDYLFVVRLADSAEDPLEPKSDEEVDGSGPAIDEDEDDAKAKKQAKKAERKKKKKVVVDAPTLAVDIEGIGDRVQRLPVDPGRFYQLQAVEKGLFYMSLPGMNGDGPTQLAYYDLEDQEEKIVLSDVTSFELAMSGDKMLVFNKDGKPGIAKAVPDGASFEAIDTRGLRTWVEPRQQWAHALDEVRRYMREFFYDPSMHGKDWDALHDRYAALLDRAAHVSDVHWLIGEYIAELNAGHAYIWGQGRPLRHVSTGYLGADLAVEGNGIRIERILRGEPGDPRRTSPLNAPGVDVKEGDWLVAIDGREITSADNPYQWLQGTAGRPVRLTVNRLAPTAAGGHDVVVIPTDSEAPLRYWDWVEGNRKKVSDATDGRVGYLHVPNTSVAGYTEFTRGLYAQHRKDALVIDVRFNGGGMIPEMFVEHLLRPHYNTWVPRDGPDWRTPGLTHHGPKVCVINGYAGSGGDALPYYFRQFGLGKLVGTTTWGGLVGIDNSLSLLIGGGITAPSFAFVNRDGEWDVERVGVAPDLWVDDPPDALHNGSDPQLDAAVQTVLEELEDYVDPVPPRPTRYPVRP